MSVEINLTVNGQACKGVAESRTLLSGFLRGPLLLTGVHVGCDTTQCGACTVLLDGEAVKSCTILAVQATGREVTTIEGLQPAGAPPHPMQEAFMVHHGLQCGYCTPGMILAAVALLKHTPNPTAEEVQAGIDGNLCRCTGYNGIVDAVLDCARQGQSGAS